jgi:magnesium chelatase subunit D
MSHAGSAIFPFSAIVGNDDLRAALLVNAVNPAIGGVLVRGEKGTAKSTAVRSLVSLLPEVDVVAGCPFSCDPREADPQCPAGPHERLGRSSRRVRLVELPVGASTDRVSGSLDVARALTEGERAFEPGLLAAAHRGVLYVDEVNLLADHLVDLLLDAAALGVNYVERDGVSVRHPARFLLIGTMNPEEGELRPQLLDRFGLSVEVRGSRDPTERAEVVRRRLAFEADPAAFAREYESEDAAVRERIKKARESLARVALPDRMVTLVAEACARLDVDGLRADIVCAKTAVALAALDGTVEVERDHVRHAALLALSHRRRRGPLEQPGLDDEELERALGNEPPDDEPPDGPAGGSNGRPPSPNRTRREDAGRPSERPAITPRPGARAGGDEARFQRDAPAPERRDDPLTGFRVAPLGGLRDGDGASGRRARGRAETGRPVGERPHEAGAGIALLPTLVAAAPHQRARGRAGPSLLLERSDLRSSLLEGRSGALLVFVIDASGSMAARRRMAAVKGAVLALLADAYQRRDLVALIAARGAGADLVLPPTASVEVAAHRLRELRAGGRTPLRAGLDRARQLVRAQRLRGDRRRPVVLLVTDGRANAGDHDPADAARRAAAALRREGATLAVVDSEQGPVRLGMAAALAEAAGGAPLVPLDALAPEARRAA